MSALILIWVFDSAAVVHSSFSEHIDVTSGLLPPDRWAAVVRDAPLVSIDLIVSDTQVHRHVKDYFWGAKRDDASVVQPSPGARVRG